VPKRTGGDERKPIFTLPKGAFLDRDEQSLLLDFFQMALDSTKTEIQRKAARSQLNRFLAEPSAARSMFAAYLLKMLDWLNQHPEEKHKALADKSPVTESNPDYELFTLNFSVNQWLRQQAEADKVRRQIDRANEETKGGGMWEGLPAI
jgi:hypothetical protein